jgi:hypothetical protein
MKSADADIGLRYPRPRLRRHHHKTVFDEVANQAHFARRESSAAIQRAKLATRVSASTACAEVMSNASASPQFASTKLEHGYYQYGLMLKQWMHALR